MIRKLFRLCVALIWLCLFVGNSQGQEWLEGKNCVDVAVVKLVAAKGIQMDEEVFNETLSALRLSRDAKKRNLSEALQMLDSFGLRCVAIESTGESSSSFAGLSIVFFQTPKIGGHCVFVDSRDGKRVVWDPVALEVDDAKWRQLGNLVVILPRSKYLCLKAWEFFQMIALGLIGCGLVVGLTTALRRLIHRWRLLRCLLLCVLMGLAGGCNRPVSPELGSDVIVHDLGAVAGSVASGSLRYQRNKAQTIKQVTLSCGCLSLEKDLTGYTNQPDVEFAIPVKIDISNKVGHFAEQLQVFWEDSTTPLKLIVTGFAIKPPAVSPNPLILGSFTDGIVQAEFDVIISHGFRTHPKMVSCTLASEFEHLFSEFNVEEIFVREAWTGVSLGVVKSRYVIKAKVRSDVQLAPRQIKKAQAFLKWSNEALDGPMTMQLIRRPPVRFASRQNWLSYRAHSPHIDTIPLEFLADSVDLSSLVVEFADENLKGEVDQETSSVLVKCQTLDQPTFRTTCRLLLHGEEIDSIDVLIN